MDKNLQAKIKALPLTSGVYLMKNADGKIIYIGKAVSLRKRVQSYFRKTQTMSKTDQLVAEIRDIATLDTHSEAQALILEANLVKEHLPKYNFDLRDDKSYPLIEVTGETFPRVEIVRPVVRIPTSKYFGPYVDSRLIREALGIG
jgi:excinuclease ABC subunit C